MVEVNFAVEFNDHSAAVWVAFERGFFEEEGVVVGRITAFRTGLELAAAMAKGDFQVGVACLGPAFLLCARGVPVKILMMVHLHGYALVAKPEINGISDLSGRSIAVSGPGTPTWLLLVMLISSYNLTGVDVKKMPPYISLNALLSGQIDATFLPEHYASIAEFNGMRVLIRSQDLWSKMPGSVLVVRREFVEKYPDTTLGIVKAIVRALRFINENFNESVRIVSGRLNADYDVMFRSMRNLEYTWNIDFSELERYVDLMVEYGAISEPVDLLDVVDTSFLNRALSLIGEGGV